MTDDLQRILGELSLVAQNLRSVTDAFKANASSTSTMMAAAKDDANELMSIANSTVKILHSSVSGLQGVAQGLEGTITQVSGAMGNLNRNGVGQQPTYSGSVSAMPPSMIPEGHHSQNSGAMNVVNIQKTQQDEMILAALSQMTGTLNNVMNQSVNMLNGAVNAMQKSPEVAQNFKNAGISSPEQVHDDAIKVRTNSNEINAIINQLREHVKQGSVETDDFQQKLLKIMGLHKEVTGLSTINAFPKLNKDDYDPNLINPLISQLNKIPGLFNTIAIASGNTFEGFSNQVNQGANSLENFQNQAKKQIDTFRELYNETSKYLSNINSMATGLAGITGISSAAFSVRGLAQMGIKYNETSHEGQYGSAMGEFRMGVNPFDNPTNYQALHNRGIERSWGEARDLERRTHGVIKFDDMAKTYSGLTSNVGGHYGQNAVESSKDLDLITKSTVGVKNVYGIADGDLQRTVQTFYKDLRMSAEETAYSINNLAQTATTANIPVNQYMKTVTNLASSYREIGLSGQNAVNVAADLAKRGLAEPDIRSMGSSVGRMINKMGDDTGTMGFAGVMSGQFNNPIDAMNASVRRYDANGNINNSWASMVAKNVDTMMGMRNSAAGPLGDVETYKYLQQNGFSSKDASIGLAIRDKNPEMFQQWVKDTASKQEKSDDSFAKEALDINKKMINVLEKITGDNFSAQRKVNETSVKDLGYTYANVLESNSKAILAMGKPLDAINSVLNIHTGILTGIALTSAVLPGLLGALGAKSLGKAIGGIGKLFTPSGSSAVVAGAGSGGFIEGAKHLFKSGIGKLGIGGAVAATTGAVLNGGGNFENAKQSISEGSNAVKNASKDIGNVGKTVAAESSNIAGQIGKSGEALNNAAQATKSSMDLAASTMSKISSAFKSNILTMVGIDALFGAGEYAYLKAQNKDVKGDGARIFSEKAVGGIGSTVGGAIGGAVGMLAGGIGAPVGMVAGSAIGGYIQDKFFGDKTKQTQNWLTEKISGRTIEQIEKERATLGNNNVSPSTSPPPTNVMGGKTAEEKMTNDKMLAEQQRATNVAQQSKDMQQREMDRLMQTSDSGSKLIYGKLNEIHSTLDKMYNKIGIVGTGGGGSSQSNQQHANYGDNQPVSKFGGNPLDKLDLKTQEEIKRAASMYKVDANHLASLALTESSGIHKDSTGRITRSDAGALGLMQLMPNTAKGLGVDPHDLRGNVEGGAKYMSQLLKQYGGDYRLATAAYNGGMVHVDEAIAKAGGSKKYSDVEKYLYSEPKKHNQEIFSRLSPSENSAIKSNPYGTTMSGIKSNHLYEVDDVQDPRLRGDVKSKMEQLAQLYKAQFGEKMFITSATRAKGWGQNDTSDHITGQAFDIASEKLRNPQARRWMENRAKQLGLKMYDEYENGSQDKDGDHLHFSNMKDSTYRGALGVTNQPNLKDTEVKSDDITNAVKPDYMDEELWKANMELQKAVKGSHQEDIKNWNTMSKDDRKKYFQPFMYDSGYSSGGNPSLNYSKLERDLAKMPNSNRNNFGDQGKIARQSREAFSKQLGVPYKITPESVFGKGASATSPAIKQAGKVFASTTGTINQSPLLRNQELYKQEKNSNIYRTTQDRMRDVGASSESGGSKPEYNILVSLGKETHSNNEEYAKAIKVIENALKSIGAKVSVVEGNVENLSKNIVNVSHTSMKNASTINNNKKNDY